MKTDFRTIGFICPIVVTFTVCIAKTIQCVVFGEYWTTPVQGTHLWIAPLDNLLVDQTIIAVITGIILVFVKRTRKNGLWFIIPSILIVFVFLYDFILDMMYPCC